MAKVSAGILVFREGARGIEVMLVHLGGPFWAKKDEGAWSIPKGEPGEGEELEAAARREFNEETGFTAAGELIALSPARQPGGKLVHAWAMRGDFDAARLKSNTFSVDWPPGSGRQQEFPEVDRAEWFTLGAARAKISKGQIGLLEQVEKLAGG